MNLTGTSMATPHVAGAVTLLASAFPDAAASEIKQAILDGANKNYATSYTKHGFLDVKVALDILAANREIHEIVTPSMPAALIGQEYSVQFEMLSASDHATWTISDGTLPQGLTMSSTGLLSGTPQEKGEFSFSVQASGDNFVSSLGGLTLNVYSDPEISTAGVSDGGLGVYYYEHLLGHGTKPLTWKITEGKLPDGLELD